MSALPIGPWITIAENDVTVQILCTITLSLLGNDTIVTAGTDANNSFRDVENSIQIVATDVLICIDHRCNVRSMDVVTMVTPYP